MFVHTCTAGFKIVAFLELLFLCFQMSYTQVFAPENCTETLLSNFRHSAREMLVLHFSLLSFTDREF